MAPVALRKESVDRNSQQICTFVGKRLSLSARRAWIEISGPLNAACIWVSLSARRAWIEIQAEREIKKLLDESLSARRAWIEINKYVVVRIVLKSLSARRAWIEIPTRWG